MTESNCCSGNPEINYNEIEYWIIGLIDTKIGKVPKIKTELVLKDYKGSLFSRFGINRMNYMIKPGIYAVGSPDGGSPVLVTANYKMTFDSLRKELSGLNTWVLVLDTKGINVWCAAGKGTFGTRELINRVLSVQLYNLVRHKTLILPQLGAVGVAAHTVRQFTGFKPVYGPVYARDIKDYLANGVRKTEKMRNVDFTLKDRIVLIPIEIVNSWIYLLILFAAAVILEILKHKYFSFSYFLTALILPFAVIFSAIFFPIILPLLPGRSFALKGGILGLLYSIITALFTIQPIIMTISNFLLLTPVVAFTALNFTGATTFTSQSGVMKETRVSVPIMAFSFVAGLLISIISSIINIFKLS